MLVASDSFVAFELQSQIQSSSGDEPMDDVVFMGPVTDRERQVIQKRGLYPQSESIQVAEMPSNPRRLTLVHSPAVLMQKKGPPNRWTLFFKKSFCKLRTAVISLQRAWRLRCQIKRFWWAHQLGKCVRWHLKREQIKRNVEAARKAEKDKLEQLEKTRQMLSELRREKEQLLLFEQQQQHQEEIQQQQQEQQNNLKAKKAAPQPINRRKRGSTNFTSKLNQTNNSKSSSSNSAEFRQADWERLVLKNTASNTGYKFCELDLKIVKKRSPRPPSPSSKIRKLKEQKSENQHPDKENNEPAASSESDALSPMLASKLSLGKKVKFVPGLTTQLNSYHADEPIAVGSGGKNNEGKSIQPTPQKSSLQKKNNDATCSNTEIDDPLSNCAPVKVVIQKFMYQQPTFKATSVLKSHHGGKSRK